MFCLLSVDPGVVALVDPITGNLSCSDIAYGVYAIGSIPPYACSLIQLVASYLCCEPLDGYGECLVCGEGGIAFPDETIFLEGGYPLPCDVLGFVTETGNYNETECAFYSSLAGPTCCAAATSVIPSAAPVEMS
jgi:hypothetical protein